MRIFDLHLENFFSRVGSLSLGEDADNVRIDRRSGAVAVGYGSGGLAIVDPVRRVRLADTALPAHPEGFQLEADRVFVNVPEARRSRPAYNGACACRT